MSWTVGGPPLAEAEALYPRPSRGSSREHDAGHQAARHTPESVHKRQGWEALVPRLPSQPCPTVNWDYTDPGRDSVPELRHHFMGLVNDP